MDRDKQHETGNTSQPTVAPRSDQPLAYLGLSEVSSLSGASTEQLRAALQGQRWEIRASAATALGKTRGEGSVDALVVALQDSHESVRAAAARALGRLTPFVPTPVFLLVDSLCDPSALVREAAATALGKARADVPADSLITALRDEQEAVRAAAAQALGRLGRFVSPSVLVEPLHDPNPFVREAAAQALGELGDPYARRFLLSHIQDEDSIVREAVAQALFLLESDISQKFLQVIMQEQEESIQQLARHALTSLKDLGLDIHEETTPIVPLVMDSHHSNRGFEKTMTFYLVGRALDTLNERTPISPLVEMLCMSHEEHFALEGVWRAFLSQSEEALEERRKIRLLMEVKNDQNIVVQAEMEHTLDCLVKLALALLRQRLTTEHLRKELQKKNETSETAMYYLLGEALRALKERESLDFLFAELGEPDTNRRMKASKALAKRAKKALWGGMPPGRVIISLQGSQGFPPVEVEINTSREERAKKDGRIALSMYGSKLPSRKVPSKSSRLGNYITTATAAPQGYLKYLKS